MADVGRLPLDAEADAVVGDASKLNVGEPNVHLASIGNDAVSSIVLVSRVEGLCFGLGLDIPNPEARE